MNWPSNEKRVCTREILNSTMKRHREEEEELDAIESNTPRIVILRQKINEIFRNASRSVANASFSRFELPTIELDKTEINFGQVTEGCRHTCPLLAKITNHSILSSIPPGSCLLAQFDDASEWTVGNYCSTGQVLSSRYDDLKPRLANTVSLHLTRQFSEVNNPTLKLNMTTNYYEFFVHLNTKELTYFKELFHNQQLLKQFGETGSSVIDPLAVSAHMSIYYCVGGDVSRKYLLNRVSLKFVLGFASIKASSLLDSIEFEVFGEDSDGEKRGLLAGGDLDMTLTCLNDPVGSGSRCRMGKVLERVVPLSNYGNIDVDLDCYFRSDESDRLRLLKVGNFEVRIEEFVINMQANSRRTKCARLVLIRTGLDEEKLNCSNLIKNCRFILEVKPDGFQYVIPVRIKFLNSNRPIPTSLQLHTNAEANRPDTGQPVASASNTRVTINLASSTKILFFGKTLSPQNQTQTEGLTNDLLIKNLKEFSIRFNVMTHSLDSDGKVRPGRSEFSLFRFTPEMDSAPENKTRITVDLKAQQVICLRSRFDPSVAENELGAGLVQTGVIRISPIGFSEKFNIVLVAFLNNSQLEIDQVTSLKVDLRSLEPPRIQKQLQLNNLTQTNYSLQINNSNAGANRSPLKKSLRLKNSSFNSKINVYPVCYVLRQNAEVFCQLSDSCMAVVSYMVDLGDGVTLRLRMALGSAAAFCHCDQLVWFEIAPNEAVTLNLEFELVSEKDQGRLAELEKRLHQNFNIGMFWGDSNLVEYCVRGIKQLEQNANSSSHAENIQRHDIALNGQAFQLESFLDKIISNTLLSHAIHPNRINFSFIRRVDYYKLLCRSLKFSLINVSTLGVDDSLDKSIMSAHTESLSMDTQSLENTLPCLVRGRCV